MSKPDINPKQSVSGIAVDPKTLERVIPESKRPDGSVRKQLKVRPGFTPQEDISRFRGSRQQQLDRNQLPKGHILGWIAPSSETSAAAKRVAVPGTVAGAGDKGGQPLTKSAAKNAKRRAKKQAEKEKVVKDSWEDSDEEEKPAESKAAVKESSNAKGGDGSQLGERENATTGTPSTAAPATTTNADDDALANELEKKLDVH